MIETIILLTTLRCDYRCRHCIQGETKDAVDFPVEMFAGLLSEARQFGAKNVCFTGGESRLHPEFEQLVDAVLQQGYTWNLMSNGSQTEPYLTWMKRSNGAFKNITLSVDGADAATHDKIRRKEGAFNSVIKAAQTYIDHGIEVRLNTCLHQENKHQLEMIASLGEQLGVKSIKFAGLIPTPCNRHLRLSEHEALDLYQQIQKLNAGSDVMLQVTSALYTRGGIHFCPVLNLRSLTIGPEADVLFCCDTQGARSVIGSLKEFDLPDLIDKWITTSEQLKRIRTKRISQGKMGAGFDTCVFCNNFFEN